MWKGVKHLMNNFLDLDYVYEKRENDDLHKFEEIQDFFLLVF